MKSFLKYFFFLLKISRFVSAWPSFYFYPSTQYVEYQLTRSQSLLDKGFNYSNPTLFIVHGFGSSGFEPRLQQMKDVFRNKINANILLVDWKEGAKSSNNFFLKVVRYLQAIVNLKSVAKDVSNFIKINMIDPSTVTCIGHSLGAHLCGMVGKNTPGLGRISGLDPAGPVFRHLFSTEHLTYNDAKLVDCIHTSTKYGIIEPICQINFYPNSLKTQPHCSVHDDLCQHVSPVYFYTLSILMTDSCTFMSTKCTDYKTSCTSCSIFNLNDCIRMGYYTFNFSNATGNFVLETKPEWPFCKN